jgi:hypothetical protein
MLHNVTNRNFVPAPRLVLDPVDAMWRSKIKWFRSVHIARQVMRQIGKSFDLRFRPMILPNDPRRGAPHLAGATRQRQNWNKIAEK